MMRYPFHTLHGGSVARLTAMRAYVDEWNANPRHVSKLASWRDARRHGVGTFGARDYGLTFSKDGNSAYIESNALKALREAGECRAGWYADANYDETFTGKAWQLPARDGKEQFIAGYSEPDSGMTALDATRGALTLFDDKEEALRAADNLAERNAEREREHNKRWQAASRANDEREAARANLKDARHDAHIVITAYRAQLQTGIVPSVSELLAERLELAREQMREAITAIHAANETIESLDMTGEF